MTGVGKDLTEIASLFIGIALIGMLVVHSSGTAEVVKSVGQSFGGVLGIATFQNQYGNPFSM
jgi:hypothetical protein